MNVMPLGLDEIFQDWADFWKRWGPSPHVFRSISIIEIAYAVVELDDYIYNTSSSTTAREQVLRRIIKDKLVNQYQRPDDNQTQAEAYGLAARLLHYCRENPREKA